MLGTKTTTNASRGGYETVKEKSSHDDHDLEIFRGPFEGFKGTMVEQMANGVVRAEVVIFGKTNVVTLDPSEFKLTSS